MLDITTSVQNLPPFILISFLPTCLLPLVTWSLPFTVHDESFYLFSFRIIHLNSVNLSESDPGCLLVIRLFALKHIYRDEINGSLFLFRKSKFAHFHQIQTLLYKKKS